MSRKQKAKSWCSSSSVWLLVFALIVAGLLGSTTSAAPVPKSRAVHRAQADPGWTLTTNEFNNGFEREAYIGNGYLGLRVTAAGMGYLGGLGKVGWPIGTERIASAIAAGVYSKLSEGTFYKEPKQAIALIPNWSTLTFGDASGLYSPATATEKNVSGYKQTLDLRSGEVTTAGVWTSASGNRTRFVYHVVTDRAHEHRALVTLELTPLWTGTATVSSVLDGAGQRRLELVSSGVEAAGHSEYLTYKSIGTDIAVAESATLESSCKLVPAQKSAPIAGSISEQVAFHALAGKTCAFRKFVAVVTGRDSTSPEADARAESQEAAKDGAAALDKENRDAWAELWQAGIDVEGDAHLQMAIRANEFDLYASIADHSPMSLGPSGLSSDGYAGMVFWDADTWMFPALLAQHPDLAKVMADYRANTLPAAKKNAADNGYSGALYPWTSGLKGDMGDECYGAVTDAKGKVIADPNKSCTQQLHLQSDVALAAWKYFEATGDKQWLADHGWPVLQAVAQFWYSKAKKVDGGGYAIDDIQTPDEYATDTNNDAFTNADASLELRAASEAAGVVGQDAPPVWAEIADGLIKTMTIDKTLDIYIEHTGYDGQKIKQADVVMLTYPLNFSMSKQMAIDDLNYYTPRTDVDGPAMTDAIYSIAAATVDAPGCSAFTYMERSYQPFLREPFMQFSEFAPIGLTMTSYDFLTGVGGFMQEFLYGFSGLRQLPGGVRLDPNLPPQLAGITLRNLTWQGRVFTMHIGPTETRVTLNSGDAMAIDTPGGAKILPQGADIILPTRRSDLQPTDDMARCRSITASSSLPGSPAVAATDGIPATAWVAADAKATLSINLAKIQQVSEIKVTRGSRDPFPYTAELSVDGAHWKSVAQAPATAEGSGAGMDKLTFAPESARYVRLVFAGTAGAKAPNIADLSVLAKAD